MKQARGQHTAGYANRVTVRDRAAETDVVLNITAGGRGDWFPERS